MKFFQNFSRAHWILLGVNALYLIPLALQFALKGDWEFFGYVFFLIALVFILITTIHKTHFPIWLLWMLSLWGMVHISGGYFVIDGNVLYWKELFHIVGSGDSYVLRFDQLVHFYGFFTTTFVAYWLLLPQLKENFRLGIIAFVAMLASMGFGAINEIIEFITVLLVPDNGVGGYYNTAIDIVTNGLGALCASLVIVYGKVGLKKEK
jgi:uncharacterized membrane protein YjdF